MSNRLVDVLDPSRKTRNKVLSKLKNLLLIIGPVNEDDFDFVNTLAGCIQKDGSVPTKKELEHCNKLWRKYYDK